MAKTAKKTAKPKARPHKAAPKTAKPAKATKKASPKAEAPPVEESTVAVPATSNLPERLLTLSFLRDDGEFCVRLEKNSGTMTELKNRSPDLLLRMVAGELEDLLG